MESPQIEEKADTILHYTTLEGLKGILESGSLWASDIRFLNDIQEFKSGKKTFRDHLCSEYLKLDKISQDEAAHLANNISEVVFGGAESNIALLSTSFCSVPGGSYDAKNGLLSQWRGYGGKTGVAIVFERSSIDALVKKQQASTTSFTLIHSDVAYGEDWKKTTLASYVSEKMHIFLDKDFVSKIRNPPVSPEIFDASLRVAMAFGMFIKHWAFHEEKEFRIAVIKSFKSQQTGEQDRLPVRFRVNGQFVIPYVELFKESERLPVSGVIIGPATNQAGVKAGVEIYARSLGYNFPVTISETPYRG